MKPGLAVCLGTCLYGAIGAATSATGIADADSVLVPEPLPAQAAGQAFTDPVFHTRLRRISEHSADGGFGTHIYSQLQAFSPDNEYLMLIENGAYVFRKVSDLGLLDAVDTAEWNAPRWHPEKPRTLVHFDSNADNVLRLQLTELDTAATATVFTFPAQYQRIRSNQSFDELSRDGRWIGGMATRDDGASVLFTLDIENRVLGALLPIPDLYQGACAPDPEWGAVEPDWVGVSPLGNYLVVQWVRDGIQRCSGLETFDIRTGAFTGRVYDGHQHGDLGVDADGVSEFFMTFELAAPAPDNDRPALGMRRLPGTDTASPPTYLQVLDWGNGDHISCQGPNGVCLVTAGTLDSNGWGPFEGELFLQYTDGRVLRLAHHRSSSCGYWVQPRASISRDGSYVVFASDWALDAPGNGCASGAALGLGDPYVLRIDSEQPPVPQSVVASGNVRANGNPVCGLVLANGAHRFSCGANEGAYWMEIPLDANGRVNLFAFADGFAPFRATLQPEAAASYDIEMMPALPSHSQMTFDIRTEQSPNRLGWVRIDADVSAGGAPLCALVLANGQHAYSCADNTGAISLEAPTDARGAVTLFGFADGFLPYKRVLTP